MVFRTSPIWNMSSVDLIAHLDALDAPDQVYWDSRDLKKRGEKFQSLDWSHWKKPVKSDGAWRFVNGLKKGEMK